MNNIIFKLTSVILLLVLSVNLRATSLSEQLLNMPIPLISGENVTLDKFKGSKPVYLKFWATWCQPCMKEMPHFETTQIRYGEKVTVIGINLGINDSLDAIKKVIQEFGLTMPIAIDEQGDLAQAFRMTGTPYHLLFDQNMNLIHQGHEANEVLDNKLSLLSQTKPVDQLNIERLSDKEPDLDLSTSDKNIHALFFTATWCDWYLKDSRPKVSRNCSIAQKEINLLYKQFPNIAWHGIVSRLWTGDKDLSEYKNKYSIVHPINIDKSNGLFHQYAVKDYPTLILIENRKTVLKTSNFQNIAEQIGKFMK